MKTKQRERVVMGLLLVAMVLLMVQAGDGPGWLMRQGLITGSALLLMGLAVVIQPKNDAP